jgi:ceramide glucosyltransferase
VIPLAAHLPDSIAASLAAVGVAQTLAGLASVRRFTRRAPIQARLLPPITVLKPLHGTEPLLAEALETFFLQDYPHLQLVFGVQHPDDPAIAIVQALCRRYSQVDATLVVDPTGHGENRKIGNLINMLPSARHDVVLISDSDMHAAPDYLRHVAAALEMPGTGLVTSLYVGKPAGSGITAQLGAAYINQIFATGAVMARGLGRQDCLGATMALRRATLRQIGGLEALVDFVADDGVLGRKVVAGGGRIGLAACVPATTVGETGFAALFSHELRWARTIRAMAPGPFAASAVQFPVFWALLTMALAPHHRWPLALLLVAFMARALCGRWVERALGAAATPYWLVPLRDVLSIIVMAAAFGGEKVAWRGQVLSTAPDRALAQNEDVFAAPPVLAHGEG